MSLSSEHFRRLVYARQGSVEQIVADVEQLSLLDKESEKQQKKWAGLAVLFVILAVVGGIVGVMVGQLLIFLGCAVVFGPLAIFAIARCISGARTNVEDRRYQLLAKSLGLVSRDMKADSLVDVRLDLRGSTDKDKFSRSGEAGPWKVKYYEDPWLTLRGRFLDGTSFTLQVVEKTQKRSRWKTSASGKMKHKTKSKSATAAVLRLKAKSEKYPALQNIADAAEAIQLPPWLGLKGLSVEDGALVLKAQAMQAWGISHGNQPPQADGVEMIASMFLGLYQILNLSKIVRKAQP